MGLGHHGICKGYVCNPLVAGSIVGVPWTLNTWSKRAKFWSQALNTGAESIVGRLHDKVVSTHTGQTKY